VDMVTVPVKIREYPQLLSDKFHTRFRQQTNAAFQTNLQKLVSHPAWKRMLEYNPIRSEHEMKMVSRKPLSRRKMEILNLGWNARTVAFDSGPVELAAEANLSYP